MKRTILAAMLLLGLVPLLGCTSASPSSGGKLEAEVRELRAIVIELQRKAAVSEVEMTRLRAQLMELEARSSGAVSSGPVVAPPPEEARREPSPPLPGIPVAVVEETDLDDDSLVESTVELFEDSEPTPSTPSAAPATDLPSAGQALYDRGYTLYHQGEYLDAEAAFLRFLEGFPGTDLADNAQYWIGECRFSRQDLRGALSAFRETVNRYPEGNKVPDALLKSGQVLEELGDVGGARASYREVQRRFPDSAAAVVASELLQRL